MNKMLMDVELRFDTNFMLNEEQNVSVSLSLINPTTDH